MRREKKSSGRNLLSRTSASKLANFPCIVWLSMHLWHWKPLGQESNSKIHNTQRNTSIFPSLRTYLFTSFVTLSTFVHYKFKWMGTYTMRKKYIILNYAMSLSSHSNIRMPARDETCKELVIYIYLDTYILTSNIAYSKRTECLNSTFRGSKRRLLVYFEDFDHPTETQMLRHCFLAPWQFLYIGLWAANAAKRAKQQNSPLKVMAAMQNFQEELRRSRRRSSSDFSFLRFFGVKLYDVIKRGGVGLQMRFTTFQCTTYTPTNHSLSKVPNKCTSWKTSFHMAGQ